MSNPTLIRNFTAGSGGVGANKIVKPGAADWEAVNSAAAADFHVGVCVQPGGAAQGERADVALQGIVEVIAGGTITRGNSVTSDASGNAVAAAPSTGVNNRIVGIALVSAVANDIIPILLAQGSVQG